MGKEIDYQTQMKLTTLVCQDKMKEAHQMESDLRKENLFAIVDTNRLGHALSAGITCKKENMNIPDWIKNNIFLEQCYAAGWKWNND